MEEHEPHGEICYTGRVTYLRPLDGRYVTPILSHLRTRWEICYTGCVAYLRLARDKASVIIYLYIRYLTEYSDLRLQPHGPCDTILAMRPAR